MIYRDLNGRFCSRETALKIRLTQRAMTEQLMRECHPVKAWLKDHSMFLNAIAFVMFIISAALYLGAGLAVWGL